MQSFKLLAVPFYAAFVSAQELKTLIDGDDICSQVAAADFDGDGRRDVAVPLMDAKRIEVHFGDDSKDLWKKDLRSFNPRWISAGLLNDDNNMDIVVCDQKTGRVSAFYGNGEGGFVGPNVLHATGNRSCQHTAIIDINGDGKQDVVASTQIKGDVYYLLNNGQKSNW